MKISDWPSDERPRERLLAHGPQRLSDAELLAIFLGSGLRGMDAVASARQLLARFGSLREMLEKPTADLIAEPGLGPARVCALKAALELGSRHLAAGLARGEALTDPSRAGEYFARRLRGLPHEVFAGLFLDNRHRAIAFEELFRGKSYMHPWTPTRCTHFYGQRHRGFCSLRRPKRLRLREVNWRHLSTSGTCPSVRS